MTQTDKPTSATTPTEDTPVSERKWTKGPWEVVEHSWSDNSIVGPDGTICTISIYDEATEDNQPELERRSASRARLIAAAPELYEALLLATRYITAVESFLGQGLEVEGWHMNGDKELFDNFFDENRGDFDLAKARAALQRAEGEGHE